MHNLFSQTIFKGIHYSCTLVFLMVRGFLEGKTTMHLHKELKINYCNLLEWRHHLQANGLANRDTSILPDAIVESDEVFINSGEKGILHPDAEDPPRVRANKKKAWALSTTTDHQSKGWSGGKVTKSGSKSV